VIKHNIKQKFDRCVNLDTTRHNKLKTHRFNKLRQYSSIRQQDVAYTRLRLGCTWLDVMKRMNKDTPCPSCGINLTLDHIFFDNNKQCPKFTDDREKLESLLLETSCPTTDLDTIRYPPKEQELTIIQGTLDFLTKTEFITKI
jgi:hypothetical protein